jgi:hypothetical protein
MKVFIATKGAGFKHDEAAELARVLRELAKQVEERRGQPRRGEEWALFDWRGTKIGKVTR